MEWMSAAAVCVGGGLGAVLRYYLERFLAPRRTSDALISAVFVINVLGSLALGIVGAAVNVLGGQDAVAYAGLSLGLLGGFTTFSTAMVEAVQALLAGRYARFVMLWLVEPMLSLISLIAGRLCSRRCFRRGDTHTAVKISGCAGTPYTRAIVIHWEFSGYLGWAA